MLEIALKLTELQSMPEFLLLPLSFMLVLTIVVFVHELGHYLVARYHGVKIEVFSIGFGPELFGLTDRHGTRWKFSLLPLGGYVRMFSDLNAASQPDYTAVAAMTEEEKQGSLFHKTAWQRFQISGAGPLANYTFAFLVLSLLYMTVGQKVPAETALLGEILPDSPAAMVGLKPGDLITHLDEQPVSSFMHMRDIIKAHPHATLHLRVMRGGQAFTVAFKPKPFELQDSEGKKTTVGLLGASQGTVIQKRGPLSAWGYALYDTWNVTSTTLKAFGQMLTGSRSAEGLSGPLGIAILTAKIASKGLADLIWYIAFISLSLGLFNLMPIPALDGGHLLYYGIEAIRGRPLSAKVQEYGFRIGLIIIVGLVLLGTHNDIVHWKIFSALKSLVNL